MTHRRIDDDRGASSLEFALVFPVVSFVVFGLIYGLLAVAAHVSLAHATSRGVRFATLASDPVSRVYPSNEQVAARVVDETPFFSADSCVTTLTGEARENAPVTLEVECDFPNPMGRAVSALTGIFSDSDPTPSGDSVRMSARAEARRE